MLKKIGLLMGILLLFATGVLSNSSPVRWYEHPTSVVMSLDEETPVTVQRERLTFDFSKDDTKDFAYQGQVTAAYWMENSSEENIQSSMVFPVIGSLWEEWPNLVRVDVDGRILPVDVLYGEVIDPEVDVFETLNMDQILRPFQGIARDWIHLTPGVIVYSYQFPIEKNTGFQDFDFQIEFRKEESVPVVVSGFNGLSINEDGRIALTRRMGDGEVSIRIDSIGEPLSFDRIERVSVEDGSEDPENAAPQPLEKILTREEFLMEIFLANTIKDFQGIYAEKNLDVLAWALDQQLDRGNRLLTDGDLSAITQQDRFLLLCYEVAFEKRQTQEVTVTYPVKGSMDRSRTKEPVYTYQYLLKPAEHWKSFQNLDIRVIPPAETPYIVESSMELTRRDDGTYQGTRSTLPDENLSFSFYNKERITFWDHIQGYVYRHLYEGIFFGVVLLIAAGMFFLIRGLVKGSRMWKQ